MNLQQLDTLRIVAQQRSFTRAAEHLNVTQSTVSMRIAQLEEEFGHELLNRSRQSMEPTEQGLIVLQFAADVHELSNKLKDQLGKSSSSVRTIRIGVAELLAPTWMPQLVAKLNQQFANLDINIDVGLSNQMYDLVRQDSLDVCFHPVVGRLQRDLEATLLGKVRFAFLASPRLALPSQRLRPRDLMKWPLISFGPDSVLSDIQAKWLAQAKNGNAILKRSNSMEATAGLVRAGLGISFLPVQHFANDIKDGAMRPLNVANPPPDVPFYAVRSKNNSSALVRRTIEIAQSIDQFDA